jgi:hypothetical protein
MANVRPTQDGIRVRETPVDGKPIGQVYMIDVLESQESPDDTQAKLGVQGQWLKVKAPSGTIGYVAAWLLEAYNGPAVNVRAASTNEPTETPHLVIPSPTPKKTASLTGMNLDINHPLGRPSPERMKGIGWIRVKFNVSYNPDNNSYGNTDINYTFNRMKPFIEGYVNAGLKCLMVFTHQLFGEGAGYHWPSMDSGRWNDLIPKYADFARRSAQLFAPTGLISVYQIWNEQDTRPEVARAAVPIPAGDYANMLTQTVRAIRSVDSNVQIISGGHVGGPGPGSDYARRTLAAMPGDVRLDGLAVHPYGRGVAGHRFSNFGALSEEVQMYRAVTPDRPIWFTEWGVLDFQNNDSVIPDVTSYASGFMNIVKNDFPGQVAAAMWYAWADSMDNGYGLVRQNDQPKDGLYNTFLTL